MRHPLRVLSGLLLLPWLGGGWPPVLAADAADPSGLVVEAIHAGWSADLAGLREGDVLRSWRSQAAGAGETTVLSSPFDLSRLEIARAPLGAVVLTGSRDHEPLSVTLPSGQWRFETRPAWTGEDLADYEAGRRFLKAGEHAAGAERWRPLAQRATEAGNPLTAAWVLLALGRGLARERQWEAAHAAFAEARTRAAAAERPDAVAEIWRVEGRTFRSRRAHDEARAAFQEALALWEAAPNALAASQIHLDLGTQFWFAGDYAGVREAYTRSLTLRERLAPGSLALAESLNNVGLIVNRQGHHAEAAPLFQRALAVQEAEAPGGFFQAEVLANLGQSHFRLGNLDEAEALNRRVLALRERLFPGSQRLAWTYNNLALVVRAQGDLAEAEALYRHALALNQARDPDGPDAAGNLLNLGQLADDRGDLALAEERYRRALELHEATDKDPDSIAILLHNLGVMARRRWDLETAGRYYQRALALQEKHFPESPHTTRTLASLGTLALHRGDLEGAEASLRRALAIIERTAPRSPRRVNYLNELGFVLFQGRGPEAAEPLYRQALTLAREIAPGTRNEADGHAGMGEVAAARGDLAGAEAAFRRALAIRERLIPGSLMEAVALHSLGKLLRRAGRLEEAAEFYRRAVAALEAQRGRLGGSETERAGFTARYTDYYREYIDLLLDLDRKADAFHVLERSRAQSLLTLLAERDLIFSADIPAALDTRRRRLIQALDRAQGKLARPETAADPEARAALTHRLRALHREREAIREEIRQVAPGLAALQYPQPLDAAGVQAVLDRGTVLLSYSVGKARTNLFLLRDTGDLEVVRLAKGRDALGVEVEHLRRAILGAAGTGAAGPGGSREGERLFQDLLAPARPRLRKSARLLIVPDGPLHFLPFAALGRPGGKLLGEWKPIHQVVSATVYGQTVTSRRSPDPAAAPTIAAFGDPVYGGTAPGRLRGAPPLRPLPATRTEVEHLRSLYGARARTFLGAEATEERAKALGAEPSLLHFACHGIVDERFPLDSGLALSIPETAEEGRDNGLLQAWEIFESVRLDADLVVLSACETGLGREMGGEGIVGLTRAFQYAGARSVLVSLWPVPDRSTATFMQAFYTQLKAGAPKDVALQRAQAALRKDPGTAAPRYWAPFVLIGDWR